MTLEQLDVDPHALLARLREREPVSWLPAFEGWLVTRHDLALAVMQDAAAFTVEDQRFSTGQVVGPSMLSLDGPQHARHRAPFAGPFRHHTVRERFRAPIAAHVERLIDSLEPAGRAELRRSFAGPLAASIVTEALGLADQDVQDVLAWYDAIVAGVTEITARGEVPQQARAAFTSLDARLQTVIERRDGNSLLGEVAAAGALSREQIISNAAILLFGGTETTEGMIAGAILALLHHPNELEKVRSHPERLDSAIDESLRLEPAAAVIDRYATADAELAGAWIAAGELVRISIAGANRDPAVFCDPDRFDPDRPGARRHLAFAQGPHVCVGVHLARLEARTALSRLLERFPRLRLDPERPSTTRGLVFRKPDSLDVVWN